MQRILVVEDDFDIQELLQNFLQEAGYEVAVANDGVEALSLFAGQRYDLIVLDIMLPKIDGYGVCELIYTLPSDLEGMPLSLLEAMSYGNCCLVSDIPECAEVVEDKALIFKKSDVEDLREKLQDACDHPEMVMKMKNQAADFICEKYNWDKVVKETMKLYRRK